MGLLDNLNFSQPFRISSLLPSEAQLQAFKDKSDAEALQQFSQDPNPIRRVPFNILTALGVNPTIAQAAPTTLDVAPVTGDISALADARTAFGQGDLATAGLLTAATILPGVPAGKGKGLLKKSDDTKPLLNVDDAPKQGIEYIPPTDNEPGIIAFHGSGADFDKFSLSKIGTGEGAQNFGYGLYFTDSEDIAKFYKNAGLKSQNVEYKGTPIKFFSDDRDEFDREAIIQGLVRDRILGGKFNTKESIDSVINQLEQTIENSYDLSQPLDRISQEGYDGLVQDLNYAKTLKADDFSYNAGKTYKVALAPKPDELLDFDKMLMDQPESIQNIIKNISGEDFDAETGREVLEFFEREFNLEPKDVSDALSKAGIKGIKYKANSGLPFGDDKKAATNFVIFDENLINILAKYGIVGGVGITALQNSDI